MISGGCMHASSTALAAGAAASVAYLLPQVAFAAHLVQQRVVGVQRLQLRPEVALEVGHAAQVPAGQVAAQVLQGGGSKG